MRRIYPEVQVGDHFGDVEVVARVPRAFTANERVEVKCRCGARRVSYVFNLRARPPKCGGPKCGKRRVVTPETIEKQMRARAEGSAGCRMPFVFERDADGNVVKRRIEP